MLLDFFQLREQPFSVSPHPSFLYSNRSRSEALESLRHAVVSPSSVFVLLGDPGVGKTTLLNQFLAEVSDSLHVIVLPHTNYSVPELNEYLFSEIRATRRSASTGNALHELLSTDVRNENGYVLVADCAERLHASALERLCCLADLHPGLSIILAGRSSLLDKLRRNPSPLSFATRVLDPFSGPETAAYIRHRLRVAGNPGLSVFERESLALIAELTRGIPRDINQLCFRGLLEAYASGSRTLSVDIIEKAARRLEASETQQLAPRLQTVLPAAVASRTPRTLGQLRLSSPNRVSSSIFLGQPLLRRAAVAALAATTLTLPYLAAKRISGSIRPLATQISSPTPTRALAEDVSLSAAAPSSPESANRTQASPILVTTVPSPQVLTAPIQSARGEISRFSPTRLGVQRVFTTNGTRFSLARELGLKISRIAIDAGHGGYDTGTIGPSGLMEKDLCLDVALRLGRMIQENIPGAEVIYTRTDDRHVPLEERTAIANDAQADLFISIHANSSDAPQIRGVETYYVSLDGSPEAREIATRENSVGDASLHNLSDLIKRITRSENLAESRQLASEIQNCLSQRLQLVSHQEANRGVKRAPFIVLTGAHMPAVLSEISFLSNPADEKLLTATEQRQRVTEGLYRGVLGYLSSMSSRPLPEHTARRTALNGSSTQAEGLR